MLTGDYFCIIFPFRNMNIVSDSMELGAAIRAERKSLGVTQKQLAMAAGTGLRFLSELERGKPTVRIEGVFRVLQALGLTLNLSVPRRGGGETP
jgi:HTH-type transcriptional regulator/antitoxin HipB